MRPLSSLRFVIGRLSRSASTYYGLAPCLSSVVCLKNKILNLILLCFTMSGLTSSSSFPIQYSSVKLFTPVIKSQKEGHE